MDGARACVPLRALLRFLRLSPSRFHAWRRLQHAWPCCSTPVEARCPQTPPSRVGRCRRAQVDALISSGVLRRMLALTDLTFSNSMIDAWWRSLKHQWLCLHSLDRVTTVRRLVAFYVDEHNRVLPHSAFRGQTPDEMYFGTGNAIPGDLTSRAAAARRARVEANRSAACGTCPSVEAAA